MGALSGGGAGVPDGGATVMLLGAALGTLGMMAAFHEEVNCCSPNQEWPFHPVRPLRFARSRIKQRGNGFV